MDTSVTDVIYERFFAELQSQATWGPAVADRLRSMRQRGELRPETLVRELFVPIVTAEAGGE